MAYWVDRDFHASQHAQLFYCFFSFSDSNGQDTWEQLLKNLEHFAYDGDDDGSASDPLAYLNYQEHLLIY